MEDPRIQLRHHRWRTNWPGGDSERASQVSGTDCAKRLDTNSHHRQVNGAKGPIYGNAVIPDRTGHKIRVEPTELDYVQPGISPRG